MPHGIRMTATPIPPLRVKRVGCFCDHGMREASDIGGLAGAALRQKAAGDYRPDLDGLRALAIGAIFLFHFDLLGATGGFVGVDIFFVLSGYLMTRMLARQNASPGAWMGFYRRRLWRIVPAYYVCLLASLLAGAFVLLPIDAERLGASAISATFFTSNFFFAAGAGYFDAASIYKPLLHTWSLAVEAQFYLIWPPVMFATLRLRVSRRGPVLLALCATSFIACQILGVTDGKVAYFSLPARLWQFGLGAVVALYPAVPARLSARVTTGLQWLALFVIAATPWFVADGDLWPAPWAAPACVATALLIWLGGAGGCGRLLAARPLVWLGQISYSLYLVHWPLLVFVGYGQFPQTPLWLRLACLALCVPLALLLSHFVETPMRRFGAPARPVTAAAIPAAALALAGVAILAIAGLAHMAPQEFARRKTPPASEAALDAFSCTPWRAPGGGATLCKIGDASAEPDALLWGDSHAMHFAQGFALRLKRDGGAMLIAVRDSCPPLTGVWRVSNALVRREDCRAANSQTLDFALKQPEIKTVFIAARWAFYANTTRFGAEKGGRAFLVSATSVERSPPASRAVLEARLDADVAALTRANKAVVLIAQAPEMGFDAARCARLASTSMKRAGDCDVARSKMVTRQAETDAILARVAVRHGARVVGPGAALCDDVYCHSAPGGELAYRDDNHLNASGALRVLDALLPALRHGSRLPD